jgi:hypothetical protein
MDFKKLAIQDAFGSIFAKKILLVFFKNIIEFKTF